MSLRITVSITSTDDGYADQESGATQIQGQASLEMRPMPGYEVVTVAEISGKLLEVNEHALKCFTHERSHQRRHHRKRL